MRMPATPQPTNNDTPDMEQLRRLLAKRAAIMREVTTIDRAIEQCAGAPQDEARPKKARWSAKDFRTACGINQ